MLEILGRIDNQVKVNGFRIELGEIESVLRAHPDVDNAVVVVHTASGTGETRLVGYVTFVGAARPDLTPTWSTGCPPTCCPRCSSPWTRCR